MKYRLKSSSSDPRPVKSCTSWYVYAISKVKDKICWSIEIYLDSSESVFDYYPEAKDVNVVNENVFQLNRGGPLNVIPYLMEFNFEAKSEEPNRSPAFLCVVSNLSKRNLSDKTIAQRLGISYKKWMEIKEKEDVKMAMAGGYEQYLIETLSKL